MLQQSAVTLFTDTWAHSLPSLPFESFHRASCDRGAFQLEVCTRILPAASGSPTGSQQQQEEQSMSSCRLVSADPFVL
jgi:hypothetical protein